jgi:hypothetical protein
MWSKLVKLIKGDRRPVVASVPNAVLGTLTYSQDDECWMTAEGTPGIPFNFYIAGDWGDNHPVIAPSSELVAHAESIARDPRLFLGSVEAFVRSELGSRRHLRGWAKEIEQLKVSALNLAWAERPNDGMIEFAGPDEFRLWRCDYINRQPAGMLGFDS